MKRVATCVIEVRDGKVTNYGGGYDAYLYAVNKEIDDGEREQAAARMSKAPAEVIKPASTYRTARRDERAVRKEISTLEKTIARLDDQKKAASTQLLNCTDATEAMRLHTEVESLTAQLTQAEDRWCELQAEIEEE
jgi:ATP-binding cassette subfamily F protein 3